MESWDTQLHIEQIEEIDSAFYPPWDGKMSSNSFIWVTEGGDLGTADWGCLAGRYGMFLTEEPIALTVSSTSTSNTEPTASAPDNELLLPSTADSSNVNTVNVSTPAAIPTEDLVDHHTVRDMKVAGCSFHDLCSLPKRDRKVRKRRLQSPSHHLTSKAHLDFVRSVLAKRQKVEEGKEHRKIAQKNSSRKT